MRSTSDPGPAPVLPALITMAIMTMVLGLIRQPPAEAATEMSYVFEETALIVQTVLDLAVMVSGILFGTTLLLTVGTLLARAAASAARSTATTLADRKQHALRTVDLSKPYVHRERADAVDCITCQLTDPGYQHTYGRERVLAGVVISRTREGTTEECVTCRAAGSIEQGLRALEDDPTSLVDELDLDPEAAHEAVEEVTAA